MALTTPTPRQTSLLASSHQARQHGVGATRFGISVIEVLAAILVAAIGLAGVMAIIPFAIGQAEQGFDQETASSFGRNFAEEFELRKFSQPVKWQSSAPIVDWGNGIVIDPIGVSTPPQTFEFPYLAPADRLPELMIPRVNLKSESGIPFSREISRSLFSWRNDLIYGQPNASITGSAYPSPELAPPDMYYDFSGATRMRRQYEGEMSCVAFFVPHKLFLDKTGNLVVNDSGTPYVESWQGHLVVYRRRPLPTSNAPYPYDRTFLAEAIPPALSTQGNILIGGGELRLNATNSTPSSQHSALRRGDWLMLTNYLPAQTIGSNEAPVRQLNFYRIMDAADLGSGNWQVTLQGPDFNLMTNVSPPITAPTTYAVHLPDVWAVIERTYE